MYLLPCRSEEVDTTRGQKSIGVCEDGNGSHARARKTRMGSLGRLAWEASEDSQANVYYRNAHGDRREADGERRAGFEG